MTPNSTRRMFSFAAVAVAGACFASIPSFASQQDRPRNDRQDNQARIAQPAGDRADMPKGIKWDDDPADLGDVREVIDDVAGAAVIKGGFNDVVERFVDQDRNRFGEWMHDGENKEFTEFNAAAEKFQAAYKQKFNKDFDFDAEKSLAGLSAIQGEVEDAAMVAANWPVPAMAGIADEARVAGGESPANDQGNIEKGRQVAIATLPGPHMAAAGGAPRPAGSALGAEAPDVPAKDQPAAAGNANRQQPREARGERMGGMAGMGHALRISFVNELPGTWKVDVPNGRMPQQVYSDLTQRIDRLAAGIAHWPSEEAQVHHLVAFEVFSAIYGVDMHKGAADHMDGAAKPADVADRPRDDGMPK